jgi:predicted dehydrogenase
MKDRKLKVGLVGLGNIGKSHLHILSSIDNVDIVGICDVFKERTDELAAKHRTTAYYNHKELLECSGLEAIVIGVPHYDHKVVAIDAFARGVHVLCEKPLAVHVNDARETIEAYERAKKKHPDLVFAMMFQERTLPFYSKIKEIVANGELGRLMRATWINTAWFRSQSYYDSGDWRATWAGEGGGILTNQCPHNLDFYQWVFGLPKRISGHASIGKYHNIEVEDEVTAYFEHDNGMIGHFIVTTAETPGTNRLEIVGEKGRLLFEKSKLTFFRSPMSVLKHIKETPEGFKNLEPTEEEVHVDVSAPSGHQVVTEKFVASILSGKEDLIAHGTEGIGSVTLANGIMLSAFTGRVVEVPFDANEFESHLNQLIASSRYVKTTKRNSLEVDISSSFTK